MKAVVLTGGSTAGLECSIGVMDYLNTPSVVGAVIYDRKIGKDIRPHLKDGFGMARAIYPVHTNWDGDVIFSISPHCKNRVKLNLNSFDLVNYVGITASDILIEAINNGVINAESIGGFPSYKDLKGV